MFFEEEEKVDDEGHTYKMISKEMTVKLLNELKKAKCINFSGNSYSI